MLIERRESYYHHWRAGMRRAAAAIALIEQHDAIGGGIEELSPASQYIWWPSSTSR
jgi:hypothetical protein